MVAAEQSSVSHQAGAVPDYPVDLLGGRLLRDGSARTGIGFASAIVS